MSQPQTAITESVERNSGDETLSGTWLLFDAQCSTCAKISQKLEEATEGQLAVLPLDSDFARRARREVFGENAPHKPTLLRVTQGEPRCWVGPRIAPLIAREIGVEASIRVLKILGIVRSGHAHDESQSEARTLSRRGFGQIAAGVAATVGILATGTFAGVRPASAAESPVKSVSQASKSKVSELISDALKSEDFLSIADSDAVEVMKSSSPQAVGELTESQFQLSTSGALSTYSSSKPVVQAAMKNMKDGRAVNTLTVVIEDAKVMYVIDFSDDGAEVQVRADRYVVDVSADRLEIVDSSSNGIRMEPVPDGVSPQASDPCGGCSSATHQALASICKTTDPVNCVLLGSGCAGCVAGCTKINAACIGCVAGSCGAALIKCCNKQEGGACFPCGAKP